MSTDKEKLQAAIERQKEAQAKARQQSIALRTGESGERGTIQ